MPRNVYWEIYLHMVWRTKDSLPLLTARVELLTHKFLIHRALQTPEAIVHAVGGIEDHVHMAVSLRPRSRSPGGSATSRARVRTTSTTASAAWGPSRGRPATGRFRSGSATCRGLWTMSVGSESTTRPGGRRIGWSGSRNWKFSGLKASHRHKPVETG